MCGLALQLPLSTLPGPRAWSDSHVITRLRTWLLFGTAPIIVILLSLLGILHSSLNSSTVVGFRFQQFLYYWQCGSESCVPYRAKMEISQCLGLVLLCSTGGLYSCPCSFSTEFSLFSPQPLLLHLPECAWD